MHLPHICPPPCTPAPPPRPHRRSWTSFLNASLPIRSAAPPRRRPCRPCARRPCGTLSVCVCLGYRYDEIPNPRALHARHVAPGQRRTPRDESRLGAPWERHVSALMGRRPRPCPLCPTPRWRGRVWGGSRAGWGRGRGWSGLVGANAPGAAIASSANVGSSLIVWLLGGVQDVVGGCTVLRLVSHPHLGSRAAVSAATGAQRGRT